MKNKDIIKCLKANKEITDYELNSVRKKSEELFYVLKHLEMSRHTETLKQALTIYVKEGGGLGSSTVMILALDDETSLKKKIKAAVLKAKAAMNRAYELSDKKENVNAKGPKTDLKKTAARIADIISSLDTGPKTIINSTEIFVSAYEREFLSSRGVHHKSESLSVEIEMVPTYLGDKEETEQYRFYRSNQVDYEEIERKVMGVVRKAELRSKARKLSEVRIPADVKVLVKGEMLSVIADNLKDNLSYNEIFTGTAHYRKGDKISDNPFELTLKGSSSGSFDSRDFDGHGNVLKPKKIIEKGVAKAYWGDNRYGSYLKEKKISGDLPVAEIKAEAYDYTKEKHLIIETFSSPQLDETSGYWGGEVRLARYFDGKQYLPLTGFAISGNIYEDLRRVKFSARQATLANYKGPKYFIFQGLSIH